MIPHSDCSNPLSDNEKRQKENGVYTPVYSKTSELLYLMKSWSGLNREAKNAILYIDEVAEAREDVMVALHPLTDFRREVYLDKINETINAQSQFMVVASFNPGYQSSLREMKPSTRQRFVTLPMNYLPLEKEAHLLVEQTGVDKASALNLAKLAKSIRNSEQFLLKETVSTRLVVNAALLIKSGMDTRSSCHVAIAEVLTDDRQSVDALKDFINLSV